MKLPDLRPLLFVFPAILFGLHACFEEDTRVPPHEAGDVETAQVALGLDYSRQVYFDLGSGSEAGSNSTESWDLGFESNSGGWVIRLNTARFMMAGNAGDTTFSLTPLPENLDMVFDVSGGDPDSTALAGWFETEQDVPRSKKEVYLLHLGTGEQFRDMGYKKIQLDREGDDYVLRYAEPDGSREERIRIQRTEERAWVYFSFEGGIVDEIPDAGDYTLLFTRYSTMLKTDEGEDYPYPVVGALLNPHNVAAYRETERDFSDIVLADTLGLVFDARADLIGYDWKTFDFDNSTYAIRPGWSFVIRDRDGFFYKLRFIDFYSDEGAKGYPKFEYVRL
ncbi:MAG: HmuY family protein [Bacteroidales bacterium]